MTLVRSRGVEGDWRLVVHLLDGGDELLGVRDELISRELCYVRDIDCQLSGIDVECR
jgi:hypothetical protein